MTNDTCTGRIRITRVPLGDAPEDVRAAWVGLELPCLPNLTRGDEHSALGQALSELGLLPCGRLNFQVPQEEAIAALEKQNPSAATYWKDLQFPYEDQFFSFGQNEAEIISGVEYPTYQEVA